MPPYNPGAYVVEDDEFPGLPAAPAPTGGGGQVGNNLPPGAGGPPLPSSPPPMMAAQGGGGGGAPVAGPGMPNLPVFNLPGAPKFNAPKFARPTMDQAMAEPGYQFRLNSGRDALERSAAAQGRLRTGGTLNDIIEYGQKFGANEYQNVYDRSLQAYDRDYRAAHDAFAPQLQHWQLGASGTRDAQLSRYQTELNNWLSHNSRQPGGGGGGGNDFNIEDLLPSLPPMPGAGGGPAGYYPMAAGGGGGQQFEDEDNYY